MSIFIVHYGLNKIELTFDPQYKIVILTLLTYLLSGIGLGLEDAGLEARNHPWFVGTRLRATERHLSYEVR